MRLTIIIYINLIFGIKINRFFSGIFALTLPFFLGFLCIFSCVRLSRNYSLPACLDLDAMRWDFLSCVWCVGNPFFWRLNLCDGPTYVLFIIFEILIKIAETNVIPSVAQSTSSSTSKGLSLSTNCKQDEFQCSDGICVSGYKRCNGINDCSDQSDENNCPPPVYENFYDGRTTNSFCFRERQFLFFMQNWRLHFFY